MGSNEEHSFMIGGHETGTMEIDPNRSRFPRCIVWTPLPILSWFFPCIGHIGICREDGVILDFAGPNFVCVDNFTFGSPKRFIQLSNEQCYALLNSTAHDSNDEMEYGDKREIAGWDEALRQSTLEYQHHNYSILTCTCHSFVANCLNRLKFQTGNWNVVKLAVFVFIKGQFVSKTAAFRTYLPFLLVCGLGLAIGAETFAIYLAIFIFVIVAWFIVGTYCFSNLIRI